MRLPFIQVAQEAFVMADTLAGLTGWDVDKSLGAILRLWKWALSRGKEEAPPDALVRGPQAARVVAAIMRHQGDAEDFATALELAEVVERTPDGLRVKGLSRYTPAFEKQQKDRHRLRQKRQQPLEEEANAAIDGYLDGASQTVAATSQVVAATSRAVAATSRDVAGQTQTQTHTPLPSEEGAADAAPPAQGEDEKPRPRCEVLELHPTEPPGKKQPRRPSFAEALYQRCEASRVEACELAQADYVPEGWHNSRQNSQLGFLAKASPEERARFEQAWDAYLSTTENAAKDPPFSLGFFIASRSTWESRAKRAAAVDSLGGVP